MSQVFRRAVTRVAVPTAVLMTLALSACSGNGGDGGPSNGSSSAGGDKPGGTIKITMSNQGFTTAVQELISQFEADTGIHAEISVFGEQQLSDKYNVELNAGTTDIDVLMFRVQQDGPSLAKNGWVADLTPYVDASPDWDFDDFQAQPMSLLKRDGQLIGIPVVTEREVLYYRTDLLEQAGLEVPKTIDRLIADAKIIQDANPGVAGFVTRGEASAVVPIFSGFLYSYGGNWVDADGKAALDSPEAVSAYEALGTLLHDYGPEGVTNMQWTDSMAVFEQGKAAFLVEADSLYQDLVDPTKSKVVDDVDWATFPAGPAGAKPFNIPTWGLAINETSQNKDAAWEFIKWVSSKDTMLKLQTDDGVAGSRTSVWENPEALKGFPGHMGEAIAATIPIGIGYDRPQVTNVAEARQIAGAPVVAGAQGQDVEAAAKAANQQFQEILDSESGS